MRLYVRFPLTYSARPPSRLVVGRTGRVSGHKPPGEALAEVAPDCDSKLAWAELVRW
jgi:hypothetical protein